jgi:hypothetical protein
MLAVSVSLVACGGSEKPKSTERLLTLDEATLLASVQFDNYEDRGAAFQVATAFLATNDTLTLQGVVDWERHVGYAVAVAKGAEDGITEVYWTDNVVLERRPAADPILTGMGYEGVRYFARKPEPDKRLLDRALAIVLSLASSQRENPQLILQKVGSAFLRTDTLRDTAATVLRFGERNLYWLDSGTNRMLRFEGNAAGGGAPTVVDIFARGAQPITFPAESTAIAVESMQELYDALRAGATATVSPVTRVGS